MNRNISMNRVSLNFVVFISVFSFYFGKINAGKEAMFEDNRIVNDGMSGNIDGKDVNQNRRKIIDALNGRRNSFNNNSQQQSQFPIIVVPQYAQPVTQSAQSVPQNASQPNIVFVQPQYQPQPNMPVVQPVNQNNGYNDIKALKKAEKSDKMEGKKSKKKKWRREKDKKKDKKDGQTININTQTSTAPIAPRLSSQNDGMDLNSVIFSDSQTVQYFYPKSWFWCTFGVDFLAAEAFMFVKEKYDKFKATAGNGVGDNLGGIRTLMEFIRTEVFAGGDKLKQNTIPMILYLARILTSFHFGWKKIVAKNFAVSFTLNHIIFPGIELELNSGYYRPCSVGIALKIGLDEILKVTVPIKLGGLFIKINGPRLSTLDVMYAISFNGLKRPVENDGQLGRGNRAGSRFWDGLFTEKLDKPFITKYYSFDLWNPFAKKINQSFENSLLYSMLIQPLGIEIGGIVQNEY